MCFWHMDWIWGWFDCIHWLKALRWDKVTPWNQMSWYCISLQKTCYIPTLFGLNLKYVTIISHFGSICLSVKSSILCFVSPDILWNIPSHNDVFGFTDVMYSPFPLFTCATTCKWKNYANVSQIKHIQVNLADNVSIFCLHFCFSTNLI